MKTVAIVQARMGSSRLPGKVLTDIVGKPVLWHVVHRLKKAKEVDEIVIATTTSELDDPIVEFCNANAINVIRGSEDNVLKRFLLAARTYDADVILRVTGDAPLVDGETIDYLLRELKREGADICRAKIEGPVTIHEGFTPITRRALEALGTYGANDPAVQEHVTVKYDDYIPDLKVVYVGFKPEHLFKGARISVDTPADVKFMTTVYEKLGAAPGEAEIADVVSLLKGDPELVAINTHVKQKSEDDLSHEVIVRCDGGSELGLGHVMRCMALAERLRDHHAVGIRFLMRGIEGQENAAHRLVQQHHFPLVLIPDGVSEAQFMDDYQTQRRISGAIFDIRTDLGPEYLQSLSERGVVSVCIDEPSDRRLACDLAFYPPVPQVQDMSWSGFKGNLLVGWEWVLLNASFQGSVPQRITRDVPQILLTMGGADPFGLVFHGMDALTELAGDYHAHVLLGASFPDRAEVEARVRDLNRPVTLHHNVQDMKGLVSQMDLAIASFGVSAYELAAVGVPSILMGISEDHCRSAQALHDAGAALNLGHYSDVSSKALAATIQDTLKDRDRLAAMRKAALDLNMGQGAENVATLIKQTLDARHQRT